MEARVPPNNKEVEAGLLGILLVVPGSPMKVASELNENDFYQPFHQIIYKTILELYNRNEAVDTVSVFEKIATKKEVSIDRQNAFELTKLTNTVVGDQALETYVKIIKEKSILRRIITLTADFNAKAYDGNNEARTVLADLLGRTSAIMQEQQGKKVEIFNDVIVRAIKQMEDASKREGHLIGIPSSIPALSNLTLGYVAPDLTIIAGGTSEGKSTLMLNEAKKAAKEGKNVLIFSLEMSNVQLVLKIFNDELNIDMVKLRTGNLSKEEWATVIRIAKENLSKLNIFMYDIGGLSIIEFQSIVKQLKVKYGDDFIVFIDYLQLMTTTGVKEKFNNREGQVSFISRTLKATCKNENIPIVALSQLSRLKEKRMYVKSDLRESGAIEQDADKIFFVWRPHYHKIFKTEDGKKDYLEDDAFIQVEKERLGQTGLIEVKFNGRYSRFEGKQTENSLSGASQFPTSSGTWKKIEPEQEQIPVSKGTKFKPEELDYTNVPPSDDIEDLPF